MRFLFSEAAPDYSQYLYPYVIWLVPDPGETPADCFEHGCVIASPDLDRFVLSRGVRVDLADFRESSENRRILRKGQGLTAQLVPRADFNYSPERREAWKRYADQRFSSAAMPLERMDRLMSAPVITHVLVFHDTRENVEIGSVLLYLEPPRVAYYYFAFYDLGRMAQNLGMFMMSWSVSFFASQNYRRLYLGTCYSERALYKTQFTGVEFFNGNAWSRNLEELKYLLRRVPADSAPHLLQDAAYLERFQQGAWPAGLRVL